MIFYPQGWLDKALVREMPGSAALCWLTLSSFFFLAYSILMHGFFGQTVGKMLHKVRMLDIKERPLSMKNALLRDLIPLIVIFMLLLLMWTNPEAWLQRYTRNPPVRQVLPPGFLVYFCPVAIWSLVEMISMFMDKKQRAVQDFIARSVVVRI